MVREGVSGYGAMLTFCERGHQDLGRRHGCRYFPRSCSPGAGLTHRIVRVAATCAFTAMTRSGRRPGTGGLLRRADATRSRSGGDVPSGLGQSGAVSHA